MLHLIRTIRYDLGEPASVGHLSALAFNGGGLIEWVEQTTLFIIVGVATQQSVAAPDPDRAGRYVELLRDFGDG